ncbi:M48 family metalloprotease [Corallococcus macrosporus]|uniref:M48 family metalloprotease n=1 Tax=Corallococcus macrosporus TaxID=35 RepID=A0ABS3DGT0_9BACT|nr:M48 family metalloprotease [Corallococcus macrosporus]MBN8230524.1 M48 family metalloprotease [Corallococcus macrosporus]
MSAGAAFTPEEVERCWRDALALWDVHVHLSPPEPHQSFEQRGESMVDEPLAYIDLARRQVFVHFELLTRMGARGSLTAVLAHEIGHHVRFPHTLGWAAELRVLEQRLIPGLGQSLTNLFFDLQVNEFVGRTQADALCAVYQGFLRTPEGRKHKPPKKQDASTGGPSPLFCFYLAIYEELWRKEPGHLVPRDMLTRLEEAYPGFRAQARMFVQTFYTLADGRLQFLYFCASFIRFIDLPSEVRFFIPLGGDIDIPDEGDLDAAVQSGGRWEDALKEARANGWLDDSHDTKESEPLDTIRRATAHLPGNDGGRLRRALVGRYYRRLVDPYILKLPASPSKPEPYLRTIPEAWEYGDDPSTIDWTLTVIAQGHLAAVNPLRRELEADLPPPSDLGVPALEIYLDTSGSMPDPQQDLNAMTLAAQVLSASALRKGATVRGIIYSADNPVVSPWMYDEETARDFFLHYIGGGTWFPVEVMEALSQERPDALRVVISDSDFLHNMRQEDALPRFVRGMNRSRRVVAFLALPDDAPARQVLAPVLGSPRFRLATVQWMSDFGRAAAALADALLEK